MIGRILTRLNPFSEQSRIPRSKLDLKRIRFAWDWQEQHENGADISFTKVEKYEHKDTGETYYYIPFFSYVGSEFQTDPPESKDERVRLKTPMMVLPQDTKHISKYRSN